MVIRIKEHSWLARLAAKKLRTKRVAMVLGNTIHLFNASKEDLLQNQCWLRHEVAHVKQFAQYGYFTFLLKYMLESAKNGYYHNRFEIDARNKEHDEDIMENVVFR